MSKLAVPFLILDNKKDYLKEFKTLFIDIKQPFFIEGIKIIFTEEDFDHVFTEPEKNGQKRLFSKRRAKRMHFIKTIIENYSSFELMFEQDSGHLAIFSVDLESVIYLVPLPKTRTLRIGTFFDFGKEHTKMYQKQKRKCTDIKDNKNLKAVLFEK